MKRKLIILTVIIVLIFATFLFLKYSEETKKYKDYADFKLNTYLPRVCDNTIEMNLIIEKAINQSYITEKELIQLKSLYDPYYKSFVEYMLLAEITKGYDFRESHNINRNYKVIFEYSDFFHRIYNLFDNKEESAYQLNKNELKVFKKSYEYTSEVSKIIKENIEYYDMFKIEIIYDEDNISFVWNIKEEYKGTLPSNSNNAGGTVFKDKNDIPLKIDKYILPEKPYFDSSDDRWVELLKEIQKLNREEL
jgi:hypothetical protein